MFLLHSLTDVVLLFIFLFHLYIYLLLVKSSLHRFHLPEEAAEEEVF